MTRRTAIVGAHPGEFGFQFSTADSAGFTRLGHCLGITTLDIIDQLFTGCW
jgi:hypothetical protein